MRNAITNWINAPAMAWQFWLPQSGITGGLIISVLGFGVYFIVRVVMRAV